MISATGCLTSSPSHYILISNCLTLLSHANIFFASTHATINQHVRRLISLLTPSREGRVQFAIGEALEVENEPGCGKNLHPLPKKSTHRSPKCDICSVPLAKSRDVDLERPEEGLPRQGSEPSPFRRTQLGVRFRTISIAMEAAKCNLRETFCAHRDVGACEFL